MAIKFSVPGKGDYNLRNIVIDLNGTLALRGEPVPDVDRDIAGLLEQGMRIFLLTGDTRGNAKEIAEKLAIEAVETPTASAKKQFVEELGVEHTVAIGNGNIDVEMFQVAKLSLGVLQLEGGTFEAMKQTDAFFLDVRHALGSLLDPKILIATMRR